MNRFAGRVAIVSGAARGIGAAVAKRLGAEGAAVAVVDINEAGAHAVAEQIGGAAFAVGCDIGEPAAVAAMHEAVIDRAGKVDVLVNAAAIVPFVPWGRDHVRGVAAGPAGQPGRALFDVPGGLGPDA